MERLLTTALLEGLHAKGDRGLVLRHNMHRGVPLHEQTKNLALAHVERLWGHEAGREDVSAD